MRETTTLIFLTQRLAKNDMYWMRPTPCRIGRSGEGRYVKEHGFGHEDWNFNTQLAIDGYVYGYMYYEPARNKASEVFNFAFLAWDAARWHVIGFYREAEFVEEGAPVDRRVITTKVSHLRALGLHLGQEFRNLSDAALRKRIGAEAAWLQWRVRPCNIVTLSRPVPLPRKVYNSKNYRITKPQMVSQRVFERIEKIATTSQAARGGVPSTIEAEEGGIFTVTHSARERSPGLAVAAKAAFLQKHGRLFCEACGFDFGAQYGQRGRDFIEAHHSVPLSKLSGRTLMRARDLRMLCSNCHRMVHCSEPWLSMEELMEILEANGAGRV